MSDNLLGVETVPATCVKTSHILVKADPHGLYLRTKNFSALNGVRCLCCLAVIKVHVNWSSPWPRLIDAGWLGVDLFFVISGFLIVTLLIRERERRGSVSLGSFYARRSLRIFPIYYLMIFAVIGFYLIATPWRPNGLRYYLPALPVLLTYTQDVIRVPLGYFFHCWSLAMEEQFYLFWPTIEKVAIRPLRWIVLGGLLLVNVGVNFGLFDGLITRIYGDSTALNMAAYQITFTPILLGVLLAYLLHDRRSFSVLYRVVGYRWSPFLFLALLFATCEVTPDLAEGWPRLMLHLTFMLLLGSLVVREDHFARPILTLPPIARMGVISYGIYLYHVWIIGILEFARDRLHLGTMNGPVMFGFVTLATVAAAEVSYRFIEQPLLRVKERFHR
jgi:peptidoglycan/LPS O-acetylase OafA/YrhL